MVLVVPAVQVHVVGVKQEVGEQQHHHFDGIFPTVHKVPVEHVRCLCGRKAILIGRTGVFLLKLQHKVLLPFRCKVKRQICPDKPTL